MKELTEIVNKKYEAGFVTQVESAVFEKGLSENIIKAISQKNNEPAWLLKFRLNAYKMLQKMQQPKWPSFNVPIINLQDIRYFASPKKRPASLDEVDPAILRDFEKLGVPLHEQAALAGVAVDVGLHQD